MAKVYDYEVKLDADLGAEHLLAVIFELRRISISEADRKLQVGVDIVLQWAERLEEKGLVKIESKEFEDPTLRITKEGLKKFETIGAKFVAHEKEKDVLGNLQKTRRSGNFSNKIRGFGKFIKRHQDDIIVFLGLVLVGVLFGSFFVDPEIHGVSFFLGALILSLTLLYYQNNRGKISFVITIENDISSITGLIASHKNALFYFIGVPGLFYSAYLAYELPLQRPVYIICAVFFATLVDLTNNPKKDFHKNLKYVVSTISLIIGILLIFKYITLSELVLPAKSYSVDVLFAIILLVMSHYSEKQPIDLSK